ncbi:MAG: cytochrome c3 family protein [Nitrospirota bacterium]
MIRAISVLSLVLLLFSCKWKTDQKAIIEETESPVISSLKDSSLPCFNCHSFEKFSINRRGEFSHQKHVGFEIHCNNCHVIKAHKESSINRDVCNNCHKLTNFAYDASGMPVNFSHQDHAKKYNCSECHPNVFHMKKGTSNITMDEMYKGNSCGKCHNGKIAFASTDCNKCHKMTGFKKTLSYPSGGVSPAIFSHEVHTAMFDCSSCHASVFKFKKDGSGMKMDSIYKGKYCGICHNGQMAFGPMECKRCHK